MNAQGSRRLLTFRLDQERRQRLKARLAREGRTMSEVVTHGLRQYVQAALARGDDPPKPPAHGGALRPPVPPRLVLPERIAARLRELRSSGRSELLSATLAALNEAGWPLRPLAEALGISRQAVQARVRRRAPAGLGEHVVASEIVPCEPPPPFPQRRVASAAGLRPHLTIKIDHTLRASAHRAAADEGSSLTQVVEAILDRYLRHGMADRDKAPREASPSR
jgi:antitoxin component of RelBE/YafQ-DinJ toxin-antitoxin module/lambda repressor-like predicted transcriptional regulator